MGHSWRKGRHRASDFSFSLRKHALQQLKRVLVSHDFVGSVLPVIECSQSSFIAGGQILRKEGGKIAMAFGKQKDTTR